MKITEQEIITALENEKMVVLATCSHDRVTIRPMSHINDGMRVFFQTSSKSLKMEQIRENPQVALCVGTYEVEGRALERGHPLSCGNSLFAEKYKAKYPLYYEKYSAYDDEIVVEVIIQRVRQWRYADGSPLLAETVFTKDKGI